MECLKARTASWRTFTAEAVSPKQAARLNKILQRKAYNKLGLLKKDDRTLIETVEESYKILMAEHFPGCQLLTVATVHDHDGPNPTGATGRHNHPVLPSRPKRMD
jgi:hypothetical protein